MSYAINFLILTHSFRYEGEWCNNKKHGYGITTFRDGTQEEGKYKNNVLITSQKKKHLFLIRSRKFRERIEAAVSSAQRASKYALQKADIAVSRTQSAREKAQYADTAAEHARIDCEMAVQTAREFAPDFKPSVLERFERLRFRERYRIPPPDVDQKIKSSGTSATNSPSNQPATTNKLESNMQMQSQSDAFQQQQQNQLPTQNVTINRRPSIHPMTKQQAVDYSQVPNQQASSMPIYSQISPQSDLSQHVSQQESMHQSISQSTHNQPNNPSYQFQQQQPPGMGPMGNYTGPQNVPGQQHDLYGGGNMNSGNNPGMQQYSPPQQQPYGLQQQPYGQQQQQQQFNQFQQSQMNPSGNQNPQPLPQTQQNYYSGYNSNPSDLQQQQQPYMLQNQPIGSNPSSGGAAIRRNSRPLNESSRPMLGSYNQTSIDYFDHYKRPSSRDPSVDRYTRAASRMSGGGGGSSSRQPSVDRTAPTPTSPTVGNPVKMSDTPERKRSGSVFRGQTPAPTTTTGNGTVLTGVGSNLGSRGGTPMMKMNSSNMQALYSSANQPFEDVLLRQRTLGQDIIPSPLQPKRTESLFIPAKPAAPKGGAAGGGGGKKLKVRI